MRLAVTRAAERLNALSSRAMAAGVEIVPLPFTQTQPTPFELPDAISLDQVDWLFFTSANGVRSFFAPFDSAQGDTVKPCFSRSARHYTKVSFGGVQGERVDARPKIAAVGVKTAAALKAVGYVVDFQPTVANGSSLFKEFIGSHLNESGVILYARAKRVNFDPQELFAATNYKYNPVICYETVPIEVDQQVVARLNDKDYILFTAPSAVCTYNEKFGAPTARPIAIGPTTATAMTNSGWSEFATMKQPDVDRVLEYL